MQKNTLTTIEQLKVGDVFMIEKNGLIYTKVEMQTDRRNRHLFTQFAQRQGRPPRPFKVGTIVIFLTHKNERNETAETRPAGNA